MTVKEILATVAKLPDEDCLEIQSGIADLLVSRVSAGETAEIREALAEAEAEFARGEGVGAEEVRKQFGLS